MKPSLPLDRWPVGRYIPAANHDAGSEPFLARQRKRIAEADAARAQEAAQVVTPIKRKGSK